MNNKTTILTVAAAIGIGGAFYVLADEKNGEAGKKETQTETTTKKDPKKVDTKKVVKTDAEWRKLLTPEQYRITREAGTERAYGKAYEEFHRHGEGTYFCVCCGSELFTSTERFDSGCGWPAFYDESKANNILEKVDNSHGMRRTEVVCKTCDAHLGHVFFNEGFNTPTDKRYCINAAALRFVDAKDAVSRKPEDGGEKKPKTAKSGE